MFNFFKKVKEIPKKLIGKYIHSKIEDFDMFPPKHFKHKHFSIVEKIKGDTLILIVNKRKFYVCSDDKWFSKENDSIQWKVVNDLNLINKIKKVRGKVYTEVNEIDKAHVKILDLFSGGQGMQKDIIFPKNFSIKCKILGSGDNHYFLPKIQIRVESVYDIDKESFLTYNDSKNIMKEIDLSMVPYLGDLIILNESKEYFQKEATGISMINPTINREGVVAFFDVTRNIDLSFEIENENKKTI